MSVWCPAQAPRLPESFPITVLTGVADLTVATDGEKYTDAHTSAEDFAENARQLNNKLERDHKKLHTQRESPSEYDHLSKIRLPLRKDSTEATKHQRYNEMLDSPIKLQKGESFSTPIPMHKKVTVVVENKESNELKFMCTGKQFVLQQEEIVMLHFR